MWASTPGDRWTTWGPRGQLLGCSVRSTDRSSCPHPHPQMWAGSSPGVAQGESGPGLPDVGDCGQLFWDPGPIGHPGPPEKFIRRGLRPASFLRAAGPRPGSVVRKITEAAPRSMGGSGPRAGREPPAQSFSSRGGPARNPVSESATFPGRGWGAPAGAVRKGSAAAGAAGPRADRRPGGELRRLVGGRGRRRLSGRGRWRLREADQKGRASLIRARPAGSRPRRHPLPIWPAPRPVDLVSADRQSFWLGSAPGAPPQSERSRRGPAAPRAEVVRRVDQ
ncbi:hypothetical protein BJ998_003840 [Kutzneria kofuensis]|uniref:Uncharacterized protein n=1 Tax=Kutzneria kofuensis TaxID=103725 RepID=A0A7W9NHK4_9PSEU|nr:hypothetical protein [Kutzneria kofuensis]